MDEPSTHKMLPARARIRETLRASSEADLLAKSAYAGFQRGARAQRKRAKSGGAPRKAGADKAPQAWRTAAPAPSAASKAAKTRGSPVRKRRSRRFLRPPAHKRPTKGPSFHCLPSNSQTQPTPRRGGLSRPRPINSLRTVLPSAPSKPPNAMPNLSSKPPKRQSKTLQQPRRPSHNVRGASGWVWSLRCPGRRGKPGYLRQPFVDFAHSSPGRHILSSPSSFGRNAAASAFLPALVGIPVTLAFFPASIASHCRSVSFLPGFAPTVREQRQPQPSTRLNDSPSFLYRFDEQIMAFSPSFTGAPHRGHFPISFAGGLPPRELRSSGGSSMSA